MFAKKSLSKGTTYKKGIYTCVKRFVEDANKTLPDPGTIIFVVSKPFMDCCVFLNKMLFNAYMTFEGFKEWWESRILSDEFENLKEFDKILDMLFGSMEGIGEMEEVGLENVE